MGIISGPRSFAVHFGREFAVLGSFLDPYILNAELGFAVPVAWASARALVVTGNHGTRIMATRSTTLVS